MPLTVRLHDAHDALGDPVPDLQPIVLREGDALLIGCAPGLRSRWPTTLLAELGAAAPRTLGVEPFAGGMLSRCQLALYVDPAGAPRVLDVGRDRVHIQPWGRVARPLIYVDRKRARINDGEILRDASTLWLPPAWGNRQRRLTVEHPAHLVGAVRDAYSGNTGGTGYFPFPSDGAERDALVHSCQHLWRFPAIGPSPPVAEAARPKAEHRRPLASRLHYGSVGLVSALNEHYRSRVLRGDRTLYVRLIEDGSITLGELEIARRRARDARQATIAATTTGRRRNTVEAAELARANNAEYLRELAELHDRLVTG